MIEVIFYKDKSGSELAYEWLKEPSQSSFKKSIYARITMLRSQGISLLNNKRILEPISPRGHKEKRINGFYELKHHGQEWRIALYHDIKRNIFVLFCGWKKTSSGSHQQGINRAYSLMYEYLEVNGYGR